MKKRAVEIFVLFAILIMAACNGHSAYDLEIVDSTLVDAAGIEVGVVVEYNENIYNSVMPAGQIVSPIEFITMPNGTRVDTRVGEMIVNLIFKHFEAIENGDVVAFRETLQGQDGASMNWHIGLILADFWDIVVGDYKDEMFWGDSEIDLTEFGQHRVFAEEFPPVSRNTGMFIKEIRYPGDGPWGGVMVALTNHGGEERFYMLGLLFDFKWPGVEWRNSVDSWFD